MVGESGRERVGERARHASKHVWCERERERERERDTSKVERSASTSCSVRANLVFQRPIRRSSSSTARSPGWSSVDSLISAFLVNHCA